MTEQEKMKQGYLWQDDEENLALQAKCKAAVRRFNELPAERMAEKEALLHEIFGEVGEHVWLNSRLLFKVSSGFGQLNSGNKKNTEIEA